MVPLSHAHIPEMTWTLAHPDNMLFFFQSQYLSVHTRLGHNKWCIISINFIY